MIDGTSELMTGLAMIDRSGVNWVNKRVCMCGGCLCAGCLCLAC